MAQKKQARVALEGKNGHLVYLPENQAAAFLSGQRKANSGAQIKDKERRVSEILSMLKGEKR